MTLRYNKSMHFTLFTIYNTPKYKNGYNIIITFLFFYFNMLTANVKSVNITLKEVKKCNINMNFTVIQRK